MDKVYWIMNMPLQEGFSSRSTAIASHGPRQSHLCAPDSQDTRARLVGRKLEGGAAPLWLHGFAGKLKIGED